MEVIVNRESWKALSVTSNRLTATTRPARSRDVLFRLIPDNEGNVVLEHCSRQRVCLQGSKPALGHQDSVWSLWRQIKPGPEDFTIVNKSSGKRLFAQKATNGDVFGATSGWLGHPDQSFMRFEVKEEDCMICCSNPGSTRPDRRCSCTVPKPYCCTECADRILRHRRSCPICNCPFRI